MRDVLPKIFKNKKIMRNTFTVKIAIFSTNKIAGSSGIFSISSEVKNITTKQCFRQT